MNDQRNRLAHWIATTFGLGDVLPAPGTTAGSFPAALLWLALCVLVPDPGVRVAATFVGAVVFTASGLWAAGVESRRRGAEDPGPVVIDEVAGQWVCYGAALPFVSFRHDLGLLLFVAADFFLFRFFDILKPWPVCRLEHLSGARGIMADDLAAGLYAAIFLAIGFRLWG